MKTLALISLFFLSILASSEVAAQPDIRADEAYGMDPLLYNGKLYRYYVAPGTIGSPFLYGANPEEGSVTLRGITYDRKLLKYDVYNQQLVMQYFVQNGGVDQFVVSDAWLEAFSLGNAEFRVIEAADSLRQIYQVLGQGPVSLLVHWRKELALDILVGAKNLRFSLPLKTTFLWKDNKMHEFSNNRSFISLFEKHQQADLKKFMRRLRINVKKSPDTKLLGLINYCNSINSK